MLSQLPLELIDAIADLVGTVGNAAELRNAANDAASCHNVAYGR